MITEKHVFILPKKAFARLLKKDDKTYYFDSLYVRESYRRRGIGTSLLYQVISCIQTHPELDIRKISKVAQRIAIKAGYQKQKESERYTGCELWTCSIKKVNADNPYIVSNTSKYRSSKIVTRIYYLQARANKPFKFTS